jgi:GNAT superfamily N-acetyltransferase
MTDLHPTAFRPGSEADSYQVFIVFETVLADMLRQMGNDTPTSVDDPEALAKMWAERKPLYDHLARSADQFWIAARQDQVLGFARSIVRGDLQQLTEFFVLPEAQSAGVGKELLRRALPAHEGRRSIIATTHLSAQALYLKNGVYPRIPLYYLGGKPAPIKHASDLQFDRMVDVRPYLLSQLGEMDQTILNYRRDIDHAWLIENRRGFLYKRNGAVVGYGYTGLRNGPFALLEAADFPAVLAHAENLAVENQQEHFGVEVPMHNQAAVDHLLGRGFRLDAILAVLMSDVPFGRFENYIVTSPPFFL